MAKSAQNGRKFLMAKDLDSKYLRVNELRALILRWLGESRSAPGRN
jgi:hypothetical protein